MLKSLVKVSTGGSELSKAPAFDFRRKNPRFAFLVGEGFFISGVDGFTWTLMPLLSSMSESPNGTTDEELQPIVLDWKYCCAQHRGGCQVHFGPCFAVGQCDCNSKENANECFKNIFIIKEPLKNITNIREDVSFKINNFLEISNPFFGDKSCRYH